MECRDVRDLADSFVGEELLTETNHELLRHLESCPACRAEIDGRRRLRESLRAAMDRAPQLTPRPEFTAALHSQLRRASGVDGSRRLTTWRPWLALAAMIILAVAIGVAYRTRSADTTLARTAVGDHRNCALQFRLAEKPISLAEAARRYGAVYQVVEQLPPADVVTTAGTARVLERHACVYGGRRFAHVVLRYQGKLVSVLVTAADSTRIAPTPVPGLIDAMPVVSFGAGHQAVYVAGDVSTADLRALSDAIADRLTSALANI